MIKNETDRINRLNRYDKDKFNIHSAFLMAFKKRYYIKLIMFIGIYNV